MCGIAGILRTWQPGEAPPDPRDAIPEAWLDILDDSIKHRGPDGQGRFRQRTTRPDGTTIDVALVHRRLSIIDHADGHQPMVIGSAIEPLAQARGHAATSLPHPTPPLLSREGHPYQPLPTPTDHHTCPKCGPGLTAVVFNGCIYNHRELRAELEAAGHTFHTDHSDTEVLLHGWREWERRGPRILPHGTQSRLRGMYAFLMWNDTTPYAILNSGRDPFGEKPLHNMQVQSRKSTVEAWCSSAGGLAQLSEHLPDVKSEPRALRANSAIRWIRYGYGRRAMRGIRDEAPEWESNAGWALAQLGWSRPLVPPDQRVSPPRTWRSLAEPEFVDAEPLTVERADRLLREAVLERLETDVPLGCFLSGGVDSSLIAAMATEELSDLQTFCVRMHDARYDESAKAAVVAKHLRTRHETVEIAPQPASDLIDLIQTIGLPFGDSSLLPASWLCRAVRDRVKVALSGDGGDELFLGYQRYVGAEVLKRWHPLLAIMPLGTAGQRNPKSRLGKLSRLASAARRKNQYDMHALFDEPTLSALIGERGRRRKRQQTSTPLWGASVYRSWDLIDYLRDDLLRKTDSASMRYSLEVRCPFLDHRLLTAAMDTPVNTLMLHGKRKGLLREVARRYIPDDIVDAPKMGFAIPIGEWFRTDYGGMRQLLYDHLESTDPFPGMADAGVEINMDFVRRMLREHDAAGERSINPWHGRDHSQRLYMLVVLSIWCKWLTTLSEPRA